MKRLALWLLAASMSLNCECGEPYYIFEDQALISIGDPLGGHDSICAETDEGSRVFDSACAFAFGEVAVGEEAFFKLSIDNPGDRALTLRDIRLEGDPAFEIVGDPRDDGSEFIRPRHAPNVDGERVYPPDILTVRFAPLLAGSSVEARVVVVSDAEQAHLRVGTDQAGGVLAELVAVMTGTGFGTAQPALRIEPPNCPFGDIGIGATGSCSVALHNDGGSPLEIFSAEPQYPLSWGSARVFFTPEIFALPHTIAPGTSSELLVSATPNQVGTVSNQLYLTSNDPVVPVAGIHMKVTGVPDIPIAVATVDEINGVPNTVSSPSIVPLDDVVLSALDSQPSAPEYTIEQWAWRIDEGDLAEYNSTMVLSDPTSPRTGFVFDSAAGQVAGIDVVGSFKVYLKVKDEAGVWSPETFIILDAIPDQALHVQLTWDTDDGDIDLHMSRDGEPYCGQNTCYYATCNAEYDAHPEWDQTPGFSSGDPVLDIDDLEGFGPENINIDAPVNGTYRVMVHNFNVYQPAYVTVKIYVDGDIEFEASAELVSSGDKWEVANIAWQNGQATITPSGDMDPPTMCSSG